MSEESKILPFEDIEVSTKTIIGISNWNIDLDKLYDELPFVDYTVIPKKRGRKKKEEMIDPNEDIPSGSIITVKYKNKVKGVDLKKHKSKSKNGFFRNSATIVMIIDKKKINFKISKNGKFQLTGCKYDDYAEQAVKYFWDYIQACESKDEIVTVNGNPEITFLTVMTNIDFSVGFNINRENLDKYINNNTEYNSLLETSFGYTGVNIKIPLKRPNDMLLKKIVWKDGKWSEGNVKYADYISTLSDREKKKEDTKPRYYTFLVFHSGKIIMSSMNIKYMKDTYDKFMDMIKTCRNEIEEKIEN